MKKKFNALLSLLLAVLMIISSAICGLAVDSETAEESITTTEAVTNESITAQEETTAVIDSNQTETTTEVETTPEETTTAVETTQEETTQEDATTEAVVESTTVPETTTPESETTEPEVSEESDDETTEHTHNYEIDIIPATTKENGSITKTCACGDVVVETIYKVYSVDVGYYFAYYDGTVKHPKVYIKTYQTVLEEGVDYDLVADGDLIETGSYLVKVVYKGKYSGESTFYFNIIYPAEKIVPLTSIETSEEGITVKWEHVFEKNTHVNGMIGYVVYRKTADTKWKALKKHWIKNEFLDTTAVYGQTYTYTVKPYYSFEGDYFYGAYDKTGISAYMDEIVTPGAPAVSKISDKISVTWTKMAGATKYILYRSTSKDSGYKKIYTGTALKFTDKTATPGNFYYYKLKYCVDSKVSSASDYKKLQFGIDTPKFKNEASVTSNSITLSWNKVEGADGYILYRRTSIKNPWEKIKTIRSGDTVSYKNKNVSGAYYYMINAFYTAEGKNYFTASEGNYRLRTLSVPEKIKASTNKNTLTNTIKWSKVKGATGYLLYAKVTGGEWELIAQTDSATRAYSHSVGANTTYYYNVKACSSLTAIGTSLSGFTTYTKVKVNYLPEFEYTLPEKSLANGSYIPVKIKNLGSKKMRIFAEGATLVKPSDYRPSEINLIMSTNKSTGGKVDYIDIPAGKTKTFYFKLDKYFDYQCRDFVGFGFTYNGGGYVTAISYLNGSSTVFVGSVE